MNILWKGNKVMKHLPTLVFVIFMNKQRNNAGQVCVGGGPEETGCFPLSEQLSCYE